MADITKEFTIDVPDELWIDKHDNSNTATYTYTGPDKVWLGSNNEESINYTSFDEPDADEIAMLGEAGITVIEIDCDAQPEVGMWSQPIADDFQHTFEDETQAFDDSVYKKITNPSITDWMDCIVDPEDRTKIKLTPIYKTIDTAPETKAKARKAYVEKYNNQYSFTTDQQTAIDKFITDIDTYIALYANCYPWKFATISEGSMPQVPADIGALFQSLPDKVSENEDV